MNITSPISKLEKCFYRTAIKWKRLLPKKRSLAFGILNSQHHAKIEHIYVINLDRHPDRWAEIKSELRHALDWNGIELLNLAERVAAVDSTQFLQEPQKDSYLDPLYTLGDQLFVEPQPLTLPTRIDLSSKIRMSRPEIAIARSHIDVWRQMENGTYEYALILEDDIWFRAGFAQKLDQAWSEIMADKINKTNFDVFYLSFQEVKHGAPKTFISRNIFRPERGLWYLSGYVLSHKGAKKLLQLLPCRGPIDLWINHQFQYLDICAIKRPIIIQRRDLSSSNSYSILPMLSKVGAITSESASLFQIRPNEKPVFAFGQNGSGLSSLAMALSMLGYRCCSDLQTLPDTELEMLLSGRGNRVFDAYVNILILANKTKIIKNLYPYAKFIITSSINGIFDEISLRIINDLNGADITFLNLEDPRKWNVICENLRCVPPVCSFPEISDLGQRQLLSKTFDSETPLKWDTPKRDNSPWVVEPRPWWNGIYCVPNEDLTKVATSPISVTDKFSFLDTKLWFQRDDTFTDNLALFRPYNINFITGLGAALSIRQDSLGVREYSAASLTSRGKYLYGRFEAIIKVSKLPGIVTGFFLHRDSPRQEIDIEIAGNRTDRLLVNVFYNPGSEGARFDYGYRGAASYIDLGFDASKSFHRYAIDWGPCEIRWFVDNRLVHRRVDWDPTPIPNLPMALHINIWPSRSKELTGRLANHRLPTTTFMKSINFEANLHDN